MSFVKWEKGHLTHRITVRIEDLKTTVKASVALFRKFISVEAMQTRGQA